MTSAVFAANTVFPLRTAAPPLPPMSPAEREAWACQGLVILTDCELALAESPATALGDPCLTALGISTRAIMGKSLLDGIVVEAAVFTSEGRFEFARDLPDQRGAVRAFVLPARDEAGSIVDLAAWRPEDDRLALWRGEVGAIGLHSVFSPRMEPPFVHDTIADWLRAERDGLFLIDDPRAGDELDGATIAAQSVAFGRRIRSRLAPHMRRPPQIVIPRSAANG